MLDVEMFAAALDSAGLTKQGAEMRERYGSRSIAAARAADAAERANAPPPLVDGLPILATALCHEEWATMYATPARIARYLARAEADYSRAVAVLAGAAS